MTTPDLDLIRLYWRILPTAYALLKEILKLVVIVSSVVNSCDSSWSLFLGIFSHELLFLESVFNSLYS